MIISISPSAIKLKGRSFPKLAGLLAIVGLREVDTPITQ
jgi:hypothetical protein